MDSLTAVEDEVQKVMTRFESVSSNSLSSTEQLIAQLSGIREEISSDPTGQLSAQHRVALTDSVKRIRSALSRNSSEHKELHSCVSRVGRVIDKNFRQDVSSCAVEGCFSLESKQKLLHEVITEHFLRRGLMEVAESLVAESNINLSEEEKQPFLEINCIVLSLRNGELEPALRWTESHREALLELGSSLEFKLYRLRFIELLVAGSVAPIELIRAAREFQRFAERHSDDIRSLMGCLLHVGDVESLRRRYRIDVSAAWRDVTSRFERDACSLLGLPSDSPLSVAISAGCVALPALLNIHSVMQQRQVAGMLPSHELPIEVDLGAAHRFHSVFACPILRQQVSDSNPPMRLVCGHVISRDSLNKLINGNKSRIKCPYCPVEQAVGDAKQIYFW